MFAGEAKVTDKDDPNVGVRLVGGKGHYSFGSFVVPCVGVKDGAPDAQVAATTTSGVYESVVCGTGKVLGTITSLAGPLKYQNLLRGKKFTMHFVDRNGMFFWHDTDKPAMPDFKDDFFSPMTQLSNNGAKPTNPKHWQAAGIGKLDGSTQKPADQPDPMRNHCTKAFTVSGLLVIDEDDGQGPIQKFP